MRIIGMGLTTSGEAKRYMENTMKEFSRLCDDVIICCNNATEQEKKLIKKYGFWQYDDSREWGREQPKIKNDLLAKVAKLKPDWVLPLDMDEVHDKKFTRQEAEKLTQHNVPGYYFAIINLWNDEDHYRHDLSFWNVRFFNFHQVKDQLYFERKRLHCGLAPPFVYKYGRYAPFLVKHYGLMKPEDRQKKVERYEKYDPEAKFKDRSYYEALKDNKYVRPFNEDEMHKKVADDSTKHYSP